MASPRIALLLLLSAATGCTLLVSLDGMSSGGARSADADASTVAVDAAEGGEAASPTDAAADARDAGLGEIAYFPFDEGQGTVAKDVIASRSATIDPSTTWTTGVHGSALSFLAQTGARATALDSPTFPRNGTVAMWIKNDFTAAQPSGVGFFEDWASNTNGHFFIRHVGQMLQVAFMIKALSNGYAYVYELASPPNNTWFHVAVSWSSDAHQAAVYVDGARKDLGPVDGAWSMGDQRFVLGEWCTCQIDEVRLWDRVLTLDEVTASRSAP